MYNLADQSYLRQPRRMTEKVIYTTLTRVREHLEAHGRRQAHFVLHGGEPLMGGAQYLKGLLLAIDSWLDPGEYRIKIGIQSNGTLFSKAVGDLLLARNVSIGISLDGPPDINDRSRVDHRGRGSSARVEQALELLTGEPYRRVFAGFLVVVDVDADPVEVYRYLAGFNPPSIDFLLPYDNHSRRPKGKEDFQSTVYADWLLAIFDAWWQERSPIQIREFDNIIRLLLGGRSKVESLGLEPVDIVVVETNGDIELVDALKGTYEGATHLGFNVADTSFDEVARHNMIELRRLGLGALAEGCQACSFVSVCGGGYIPNRYCNDNGFRNPSIYCHDLMKLIATIEKALRAPLVGVSGHA
jgi:uncharacterized protein